MASDCQPVVGTPVVRLVYDGFSAHQDPHLFQEVSVGAEPLGREVAERTVDSETVVVAAKSCPYRAIFMKDAETGDELAGYP